MAVTSFQNLLSVDEWASIFGVAPEFMNGFDRDGRRIGEQCQSVWYQYAWMDTGDRLSREELAEAIHQAEKMLTTEMLFSPAPIWTVDERVPWPRHSFYSLRPPSVHTKLGKVIAGGIRATTLLSAGATVTYSKSDGNTSAYQDKATITVTTTVTEPCEIQVFFRTADGAPEVAHPRYQIKPLRVSISGGVATITGDRAYFVSPEFHEFQSEIFTAADIGAGAANFVQTVDVYRVYNDTNGNNQQQGVLVWETNEDCPTPPCAVTLQTMCLGLRNRELGDVVPTPSSWNTTTLVYDRADLAECRVPDRVRMNYYSGVPLELGADGCRMNRRYARLVARLAMAFLPKVKCGCEQAERQMQYWFNPPDLERENVSQQRINNPFGQARGAMAAWFEVLRERPGEGLLIT